MKRMVTIGIAGLLVVSGFIGIISLVVDNVASDDGSWTTKLPMQTARRGLAIGVVDDKIYAIGGYKSGIGYLDTCEEYDPVTDSWVLKTPMPTPRYEPAIGVVDGKIYVIGGLSATGYLNICEEYDPFTDTWSIKTPMLTKRSGLSVGVISNKIYAIGGKYGGYLNICEEYDPDTDSWVTKTPMPSPRYELSIGIVDGKIYAIGGYDGDDSNKCEEYNPATDIWTTKALMLTARHGLDIGVVNNKIYAIGGYHEGNRSECEEYDPSTNTWITKTPMPTQRSDLAIGVVNDKIYAIGGRNYTADLAINEEFTPLTNDPPVISSGGVSPTSGDTATIFTYQVTYTDANNDGPTVRYVYIDGSAHTMSHISGSYVDGAIFRYSTTLLAGSHNYYFYFEDGNGGSARLPTSGTYGEPSVSQQDTTPPAITKLQPLDGSTTNNNTPIISASYSDSSGIDVNSVILEVDNVDVTSSSTVTANGVTYMPLTSLSDDVHTIYLEVEDSSKNHNKATKTWSFTVDTTAIDDAPPEITDISPPNNSTINNNTPTIGANYSDAFGIDLTSVILRLNNVDITSSAIITANGVTYMPLTSLSDDVHTIYLEVEDSSKNHNKATKTWSFTVDATPPTIIHTQITSCSTGSLIIVTAMITDNVDVTNVTLHYKNVSDVSFSFVMMITESEGVYIATIPVQSEHGNVYYYISASDGMNIATHPTMNATTSPHTIIIYSEDENNWSWVFIAIVIIIITSVFLLAVTAKRKK